MTTTPTNPATETLYRGYRIQRGRGLQCRALDHDGTILHWMPWLPDQAAAEAQINHHISAKHWR